jgi:hypothetical protein
MKSGKDHPAPIRYPILGNGVSSGVLNTKGLEFDKKVDSGNQTLSRIPCSQLFEFKQVNDYFRLTYKNGHRERFVLRGT